MRQFELFVIITQPIALMSLLHAKRVVGCIVSAHLIPRQASQRLSMARYTTGTATAEFEPSANQHLPAGSRHAIY